MLKTDATPEISAARWQSEFARFVFIFEKDSVPMQMPWRCSWLKAKQCNTPVEYTDKHGHVANNYILIRSLFPCWYISSQLAEQEVGMMFG